MKCIDHQSSGSEPSASLSATHKNQPPRSYARRDHEIFHLWDCDRGRETGRIDISVSPTVSLPYPKVLRVSDLLAKASTLAIEKYTMLFREKTRGFLALML